MRFSVTQDRIDQTLNYSGQVTQADLAKYLRPEDQAMLDEFQRTGMTMSGQLYMLYILFTRYEQEGRGPRMECVHAKGPELPEPIPEEPVKGRTASGRRIKLRKD